MLSRARACWPVHGRRSDRNGPRIEFRERPTRTHDCLATTRKQWQPNNMLHLARAITPRAMRVCTGLQPTTNPLEHCPDGAPPAMGPAPGSGSGRHGPTTANVGGKDTVEHTPNVAKHTTERRPNAHAECCHARAYWPTRRRKSNNNGRIGFNKRPSRTHDCPITTRKQ